MRILIAEDDPVSRRLLEATLTRQGYDVVVTCDGGEACRTLREDDAPGLVVLDWMMPEMDGVELCEWIRKRESKSYTYILLLTAKGRKSDVVAGLEAGADDYLVKPFDRQELHSRIRVGERVLLLQERLAGKIDELQSALSEVKQLQGMLPICMHCKRIRDDRDTWHRLENYLEEHSDVMFTHSLCQGCLKEHYPEYEAANAVEK
ncbi:MAG: response regulator [bacterium]|nr:response regulator [bacterium]